MLEAADGVERGGDQYSVAQGYRLSVYIGEPGQAMEVSEIEKLKLGAAFFEATSREHNSTYFVEYSTYTGSACGPRAAAADGGLGSADACSSRGPAVDLA